MSFTSVKIAAYCVVLYVVTAEEYKLTKTSGRFESKNYPNTYPDNLDVTWNIEVRPGRRIFLNFTDFDLESSYDEDMGGPCVYDYLEVKEGDKVIRRYCGNQDKHPLDAPSLESYIETCGNKMTLRHVSDFSNVDPLPKGFSAFYKEIDVTCGEAPNIQNGGFKTDGGAPYERGAILEYSCNDRFELKGEGRLVCQKGGRWEPRKPPTCTAAGCSKVSPPRHGKIVSAAEPPYKTGAVLQFICDRDFRMIGERTITCQGRDWSSQAPKCYVIKCEERDKKLKRADCRRPCTTDRDCSGSNKKCLCDGQCGLSCFNPGLECPDLPNPINGFIEYDGHNYGDTLMYRCNNGFTINGIRSKKCQSDKLWSNNEKDPTCVPYNTCGQAGDAGELTSVGRVVDGKDANVGAWPWQALILQMHRSEFGKVEYRDQVRGGGSIVNEKWILTAAHVFNSSSSTLSRKDVLILLGMTKLPEKGSYFPEHVHIHYAEKIIQNPGYKKYTYDYDVALILIGDRLRKQANTDRFVIDPSPPRKSIVYSEYIRRVCMVCLDDKEKFDEHQCEVLKARLDRHANKGNHVGVVTGFGYTNEEDVKNYIPKNMKQGAVKVLPDASCKDAAMKIADSDAQYAALKYTRSMLCTKTADENINTDACKGDSGGPLVRQFERKSMWYYYQIGIVSWGMECGSEHPGFFTDLSEVMPWVYQVINQ